MITAPPSISIIIPCWNDGVELAGTLRALAEISGVGEIIVADASSSDECERIARESGAIVVRTDRPNRGRQMNAGAAAVRGDVLLFHHADSVLCQAHLDSLAAKMADETIVGGAFHRRFDARHPAFRWIEPIARFMSERGGTLYGDQSIFVRRSVFEQLGGFADIPLMEDMEFSRRLRRAGCTVVLDPPMSSSPRRHVRRGALRTSIQNGALIFLYKIGVAPKKLHAMYYGRAESLAD